MKYVLFYFESCKTNLSCHNKICIKLPIPALIMIYRRTCNKRIYQPVLVVPHAAALELIRFRESFLYIGTNKASEIYQNL